MIAYQGTLIVLLVILFFGLIGPEFFKKFKLPFVTLLIVLGGILGPHGFAYLQSNDSIELFGFLGSSFLMLLAGLEVKSSYFVELKKKIYTMVAINTLIPFLSGLIISKSFGYNWVTSVLVGIIFSSSSIAIVASAVKQTNLAYTNIGKLMMSVIIIEDILGLIFFTVFTQSILPTTIYPPLIYLGILISSIILMKMFLPEISKYYFKIFKKDDENELQLRFVILILLLSLIFFSWLGVHPIVASFIVGVLLADVIKSKKLFRKLHTLGYGLFVPIFFFAIGMQMDLKSLLTIDIKDYFLISIILGLILSKFLSGYFAARLEKLNKKEGLVFGISSTAKLTTTLAATYATLSLNLIDTTIATALIIVSIITTILAPIALSLVSKNWGNIID